MASQFTTTIQKSKHMWRVLIVFMTIVTKHYGAVAYKPIAEIRRQLELNVSNGCRSIGEMISQLLIEILQMARLHFKDENQNFVRNLSVMSANTLFTRISRKIFIIFLQFWMFFLDFAILKVSNMPPIRIDWFFNKPLGLIFFLKIF